MPSGSFLKSVVQVGDGEGESGTAVAVEDDEEGDEEAHNVVLPAETIDRKESVELWKSRNETDVIGGSLFGTVLYCTVLWFSIRPRRVRH